MSAAYYEIFQLLDRDGSGWLRLEVVIAAAQSIEGVSKTAVRKTIINSYEDFNDDESVEPDHWEELMEVLRLQHTTNEVPDMVKELRIPLIEEVFRAKQNKDAKLSKGDIKRFFETLPSRVSEKECERLFEIVGLERQKYLNSEDFTILINDGVLEHSKSTCLSDIVSASRSTFISTLDSKFGGVVGGVGKKIQALAGTSFNTLKGSIPVPRIVPRIGKKKDKTVNIVDDAASIPSNGPGSPKSTTKKWLPGFGRRESSASPLDSPSGEGAFCSNCSRIQGKESLLRSDLVKAQRESTSKDTEIDKLKEKVRSLEVTCSRSDGLRSLLSAEQENIKQLKSELAESKNKSSQLSDRVDNLRKNDKSSELIRSLEMRCQELTTDKVGLDRKLREESEKLQETMKLRNTQADADTKRKAEMGKMRHQLKDATQMVSDLQKRVEELEVENRTMEAGFLSPSSFGKGKSFPGDGDDTSDDGQNIIMLSPQRWSAKPDNQSTLFEDPSPIVYNFNPGIRPVQIFIDIHVVCQTTAEYITMRDSDGNRSVSLTLSDGMLFVPCTTLSVEMPSDAWHSTSIVFDWSQKVYSLFLGTRLLHGKLPFRDSECSDISVFDVHPRESTAVVYANIRFVGEEETPSLDDHVPLVRKDAQNSIDVSSFR